VLKLDSDSVAWDACNVIECSKIFRSISNEVMMKCCSLCLAIKRFGRSRLGILLISDCWLTVHWRKNESVCSIAVSWLKVCSAELNRVQLCVQAKENMPEGIKKVAWVSWTLGCSYRVVTSWIKVMMLLGMNKAKSRFTNSYSLSW